MQIIKNKMKKVFILQMIFIICLSMIFNMTILSTKVQAVTQSKRTGIDAFPESYQQALRELQNTYSNWTFTAFYTGLNWQDFINGESSPANKNTMHSTDPNYVTNQHTGGGYYCARPGIIAYYADPRNFLDEAGIFQFLEMSYNSSVHNKEGVEKIIKNTFMNASVTISAEREDTSIKAKQEGGRIIVKPGTKNSEVAQAIGMTNFEVKNKENKTISANDTAGTGYKFINKQYNTEYTMIVIGDVNCDGAVKASDYMKIKNYIIGNTTLSEIEKVAADTNGDGEIKASDYMKTKNHIIGNTEITISETTSAKQTMRYSEIIMKAAEESGISPYSIAIKIIQEVGSNGSGSVSGKYPGYEGYYNFFNWGATDGDDAIRKGLEYAKGKGWNNQYTAIVEGAKQMSDSYVSIGQNTAYFYKFNVIDNGKHPLYTHQYMTNIEDPSSQARILFNRYGDNRSESLNFIIPVFNNMPDRCEKPTGIDKDNSNTRYIDATDVSFRSSPNKGNNIMAYISKEYVTVLDFNAGNSDGIKWAKIRRGDGSEGYVTSEYFKEP
ncbi:MAG: hypothetical protein HFJ50_09180 [Clostridia bacterium]|jgi:beta-N-acetylglucosaminidase|nr:hypothetical protein [Clostridia bacterium]